MSKYLLIALLINFFVPCSYAASILDITQITNSPNDRESYLVWSPDGSKIAFNQFKGQSMLYAVAVVDENGANYQVLTPHYPNNSYSDGFPAWSPDGTKISFYSGRNGPFFSSTWLMNSDGSNQHQISGGGYGGHSPNETSPDGSKIVYTVSEGDIFAGDIKTTLYVMNSDGSNKHSIYTDLNESSSFEGWSALGSHIALRIYDENDIGNYYSLWTIEADGTDLSRISPSGYIEDLGWSPTSDNTIALSLTHDNWSNNPQNDLYVETLDFTPVPEPATLLLFGLGGIAMAAIRRKKR